LVGRIEKNQRHGVKSFYTKFIKKFLSKSHLKDSLTEHIGLIDQYFDKDFYHKQVSHLGLSSEGHHLIKHYLLTGYKDDKMPNEYFNSVWYQKNYNVDKNIINPFIHYLLYGSREGKAPSLTFDLNFYLHEYPDVRTDGAEPLLHYLLFGKKEGRFTNAKRKNISILKQPLLSLPLVDVNELNLNGFKLSKNDIKFRNYLHADKRGTLSEVKVPEGCKLISFDIWDTVLRRKVDPDEIKLSAARFLFINYSNILKPAFKNILGLYKARKKSEDMSSLTEDFEYRYADAILLWLTMVIGEGVQKSKLTQINTELLKHEFLCEKRASQLDKATIDFINNVEIPNICFASDFYMSSEFINSLLTEHDVHNAFLNGYSSCDVVKNKRSGELFDHIIDDYGLKPQEIFHIGDNSFADVKVPAKKGISTFHYHDHHEDQLHKWFSEAFKSHLQGDSSKHEERILSLLEGATCNENSDQDRLRNIGTRLAPIALGLVLKIIEESKRLDSEKVFFFTREGAFIKKIYDYLVDYDPYFTSYANSQLLEVSRLATFAPSLKSVDVKNLMRLWLQYSSQSPEAFARTLNIDLPETKLLFEKFGFDYKETVIYPWKNDEFTELLGSKEFQKIIDRNINVQKKNITSYLKNMGLEGDSSSFIVVDLGWRGTIHDNISHIVNPKLHGVYLGLFRFLNDQRSNVSKHGWLFDMNLDNEKWREIEVGPLEMLFNSLGGSTIAYHENDGEVIAERKSEETEDKVFNLYTKYLQEGIMHGVSSIIEYVSIHGLCADDLKPLARKITSSLIEQPPKLFAKAFFDLTHNETFGTGGYQKMQSLDSFEQELKGKAGSALHYTVSEFINKSRWPQGFISMFEGSDVIDGIDTPHLPLKLYKRINFNNLNPNFKVAIYAPEPMSGSGGHRTLFNLARKFSEAGCQVYCLLEIEGSGIDTVRAYLRGSEAIVHIGWPEDLSFDMAVATIAHSAKFVANLPFVKHKAYLVQDFEAWFNPIGDAYTVAENSYTFDMTHFTVGNFLSHVLQNQYTARVIPAGLGVDTSVYFDKEEQREDAICFLYQPEKFRRNPLLAIESLSIVKKQRPDIKIYVYGSDADLFLDFEVENLGLIHDLTSLNDLYNCCKVGLCISMTNPSRIPFELMAAGTVPVDVYRYNNLLDYPDSTLKLAYQSPDSIAEAIIKLFEDEKEYSLRKEKSIKFAISRTLEWEMDVFVNSALSLMNNKNIESSLVQSEFSDPAFISEKDKSEHTDAFCDWQKKLAANK
jgi:predicted HAD superfamily hydrolase/glycosyltransferase involved in cell wall biosynthesis